MEAYFVKGMSELKLSLSSQGQHPFHLVTSSPWPFVTSWALLSLVVLGFSSMFSATSQLSWALGLLSLIMSVVGWWRDVVREGTFMGCHTSEVQVGLRLGMIMFILSEVMFFFSFFFGYFYLSLSPDVALGSQWPPFGVQSVSWMSVPMVNTLILLSSGVSVTWCHHSILSSNYTQAISGLTVTVLLGVIFMVAQVFEYFECSFSMADSCFGSIFFLATGFHGAHVFVGTLFLTVALTRISKSQMSSSHHFGFEAAAWYWHFVDVVWLFLFICIYWWGS
uniref:Cytochrome c oxidase subunit 3 n=1 Tax=Bovicola bovis TaxID=160097 RepID=A0A386B264_9NEOP|nr:cytochrome c oxidase subunit III [Bovicola bovis]